MLDAWTETVPASHETTGVAFHYNRPNATAPQAVLLAVPATQLGHWTWDGLIGSVHKVYKNDEVAVEIETDALPEDVWKRHMQTRDQMRQRWLEGLSGDVRRKLTPDWESLTPHERLEKVEQYRNA